MQRRYYGHIFTARNSSCGKVMFSQAFVIPSVHREGGLHGGDWADPPHGILRDTVNERAVRILLECILIEHQTARCKRDSVWHDSLGVVYILPLFCHTCRPPPLSPCMPPLCHACPSFATHASPPFAMYAPFATHTPLHHTHPPRHTPPPPVTTVIIKYMYWSILQRNS